MSLISGEIVQVYAERDVRMGKVKVGGAYVHVPLSLVEPSVVGDTVLIESGVAIAKLTDQSTKEI